MPPTGRCCPNFYRWSRAETERGLVWVHHGEGVFHFPLPSAQSIEGRKREKEGGKAPAEGSARLFWQRPSPPSRFLPTDFIYFT